MISKKNVKYLIVLVFIVLLGFFVRIYKLDQIPSGFFCDEAGVEYNAYKLLRTGADEYGVRYPFFFRSFGDYRLPINFYSNIPFVALFGLNEFSARATSAFFGTLTIPLIFLFTLALFKNRSVALFSTLFIAISPWHIHFSRFDTENIYFLFWFTLALYLFLKGVRDTKVLLLSFFVFGISLYTYYPALFTVPLFVASVVLIFIKQLINTKRALLLGLAIFLITLAPFFIGVKNGTVLTRWKSVSIFKWEAKENIAKKMVTTYFAHFSSDFLFTKGDIDYPGHFITRFSVRGMGELYKFQLLLLILGIVSVLHFKKSKESFLLLTTLFLLYPLGSTLAGADGGGPFATRSILGVIPFQILSALGVVFLFSLFRNKIIKYVLIIILLLTIAIAFKNYLHRYFIEYPMYSSDFWGWQYGARDIVNYFSKNQNAYDELIMIPEFNAPEIFFKFYSPNNCSKCRLGNPKDNYNPNIKQLFAVTPSFLATNPNIEFGTLKTVYYPNNTIALKIGKVIKK